jgi:hypothetical protein
MMNKYAFLLVPFLAASSQLVAGTVASVSIDALVFGFGGQTCRLTSTGASISCGVNNSAGIPVANSQGSASASLGFLSVFADAAACCGALADAGATAQYDYFLNLPGAASGVITGQYLIRANTRADFNDTAVAWDVSIGQGGSTFQPRGVPFLEETVTLSSSFTAGETLEITGWASGSAGTPGLETTHASLQLIGLFDQAGNPVAFAEAPEPVFWPVLLISLAAIYTLRPTGRTNPRATRN